jgi:hypothetical protein
MNELARRPDDVQIRKDNNTTIARRKSTRPLSGGLNSIKCLAHLLVLLATLTSSLTAGLSLPPPPVSFLTAYNNVNRKQPGPFIVIVNKAAQSAPNGNQPLSSNNAIAFKPKATGCNSTREFQCSSNSPSERAPRKCIKGSQVCDGIADCADKSDEKNCECKNI